MILAPCTKVPQASITPTSWYQHTSLPFNALNRRVQASDDQPAELVYRLARSTAYIYLDLCVSQATKAMGFPHQRQGWVGLPQSALLLSLGSDFSTAMVRPEL